MNNVQLIIDNERKKFVNFQKYNFIGNYTLLTVNCKLVGGIMCLSANCLLIVTKLRRDRYDFKNSAFWKSI
jgi:hypothetical protein